MTDPVDALHADVMNIQVNPPGDLRAMDVLEAYKMGHRDARHAAAELVVQAGAKRKGWREIDPSSLYPIG